MKKILYFTIILSASLLSACKKDHVASSLDLVKDSVYYYSAEAYLWNYALPSYNSFKPRGYTGKDDITALTSEVDGLSQYAINPTTNLPYEYSPSNKGAAKYSFIDDGSVSTELGGTNQDYGFSVSYQDRDDLRVKYVFANSAADKAGLKRGYQITKINGSTAIDYDNNVNTVVNAIFYSKTVTLTLQKPDNTTFDVSLAVGTYTSNPVLTYKVLDNGAGKKVGYIVFNTFTVPQNASPLLQAAFNSFTQAGITELVVDLRYNGGGSVATAEILDNYIVPPSKNGTQMYTYYYNDKLQKDIHPLLSNLYKIDKGDFLPENNRVAFAKLGSLNLSRVFFIVTGSTASASELTINNLIPEMDVKLIGMTSYGKPVGFFAIDINKYQLYVPEFETKNSANKGGYYAGMTPGSADYPGKEDYDDLTKDFGDPTEVLLQHALNFISTGTYDVARPKVQSLSMSKQQMRDMSIKLDDHKFNGMIGNKTFQRK